MRYYDCNREAACKGGLVLNLFPYSSATPAPSGSFRDKGPACAVRVSFIDVGKGDCILIQAGTAAALIDTGYTSTSDDVLSHLRKQGVNRLEFVIITHYDRDHIGGLRAIGQALQIGMVYLPAYEGADKNYRTLMKAVEELGLPMRRIGQNQPIELGAVRLDAITSHVRFVPDANGDEGNDNDLSLAAFLVSDGSSYLFTGDLEEDGIASFREGGYGRFDIIKMPCHGRKSPLTDELLADTLPKIAIITDSTEDPANNKVLKMLEEMGIDVYRTSVDGTIVIESDGTGGYAVS